MVDLDVQISVVNEIVGRGVANKDVVKRRMNCWRKWWQNNSGGGDFRRVDVPLIAKKYPHAFSVCIPDDVNWTRDGLILRAVEGEMKEMLRSCGEIGGASNRSGTPVTPRRGPSMVWSLMMSCCRYYTFSVWPGLGTAP